MPVNITGALHLSYIDTLFFYIDYRHAVAHIKVRSTANIYKDIILPDVEVQRTVNIWCKDFYCRHGNTLQKLAMIILLIVTNSMIKSFSAGPIYTILSGIL